MAKKRIQLLVFNVFLTVILLFVVEIALRILGYQPGDKGITSFKFMEVDSLYLTNEFLADSFGITKANPEYPWPTPFKINQLGFRTNELEDVLQVPKPNRLLLIGDSFTWGLTAKPITNCFADLLDSTDFMVFNSGIPTVGPNQYAKIAEQLIPILEPEMVVVFFFIGNDLFDEKIPLKPYQVAYYKTNAGVFDAYINGEYVGDYKEAYQYYRDLFNNSFSSRKTLAPIVNFCLRESVVCYMSYNTYRKIKKPKIETKGTAYLDYLNEIKEICERQGSNFKLFIIPDYGKPVSPDFFPGFAPLIPTNLNDDDYVADGHFNNKGHRKFFKFVISQLGN